MTNYEKKYNEAVLRADEAVQKGCLDKDMFDIIFPPEESEDERIRKALVWHLKAGEDFVSNGVTKAECLAYLEKQKEKEQKPAWSEEDEKMLIQVFESIRYADDHYEFDGKEVSSTDVKAWLLKSLRPQYHGDVTMTEAYKMGLEDGKASSWKPSDHQMNILKAVKEYVGRGSGYWGEGLGSLIEDLEKLM